MAYQLRARRARSLAGTTVWTGVWIGLLFPPLIALAVGESGAVAGKAVSTVRATDIDRASHVDRLVPSASPSVSGPNPDPPAPEVLLLRASPALRESVVREIDDPALGQRWILTSDSSRPGGPGRLLLREARNLAPKDAPNPSGFGTARSSPRSDPRSDPRSRPGPGPIAAEARQEALARQETARLAANLPLPNRAEANPSGPDAGPDAWKAAGPKSVPNSVPNSVPSAGPVASPDGIDAIDARTLIRAGDRIVVEQRTPVLEARFEALALESAAAGTTFDARLKAGGRVIRVTATGVGQAVWITGQLTPSPNSSNLSVGSVAQPDAHNGRGGRP